MTVNDILDKVRAGICLTEADAVRLIETPDDCADVYSIFAEANHLTRTEYASQGYVFAQIGLNSEKCSGGCKFCSLADCAACGICESRLTKRDALQLTTALDRQKIDALFLMTTADYQKSAFLDMASSCRAELKNTQKLVANIGDFDVSYARELKGAGVDACYHVVRLREGTDTAIDTKTRIKTLDAIVAEGLELFYCVEPIGFEHTPQEIAAEMLRARAYAVHVMAVMKRVPVMGTEMAKRKSITNLRLTKIAAIARLVTRPKTSMNVHEPVESALLCGVNQLYAEVGVNPRDIVTSTENGRGFSVGAVRNLLGQYGYHVK